MDISIDERDEPEIEAGGPRPEESELEDLNLLDDDYADDEEGDVLGSLPQLQIIPSTLSSQNAEYALTIPMSVSSMSFSISPSMSSTMSFSAYTSPSLINPQQPYRPMAAFDSVLSDDASDADVEDYSAYLSLYSAYTDYTGYTANTTNTNATGFSTQSNSSMVSTQLVPSTASCGPMSCFEADGEEEEDEEVQKEEQEEPEETACVPIKQVVDAPDEDGDMQANAKEGAEKTAPREEPTFGCFADMSWFQCPLFKTTSEEQSQENAANNAIVIRNTSNIFVPSLLSTHRRMGREDLLRLAIATILNLVSEHSAAAARASSYRPTSQNDSLARKTCSDVVVYQPPTTSAQRIPAASTTSTSSPTQDSTDVPNSQAPRGTPQPEPSASIPSTQDETSTPPSPEAIPVVSGSDCKMSYDADIDDNLPSNAAPHVSSMPSFLGSASFLINMLFGSADLATGVMLELEANGVFLKAAEKFSAMDEDAQFRFIDQNNHLLLGPSQHMAETKASEQEDASEEVDLEPSASEMPISGVSSSHKKEEEFFQALLQLVLSSITNALEEISGYFKTSYTAKEESVERAVALTAPKVVAKIIENDIMEQLETSSSADAIPPIEKMPNVPEEGVEVSVEQHQALRGSKSLFDNGISLDFSRYLKAVRKTKAHLATTKTPSTAPEDIPEPKVSPSEKEEAFIKPNDPSKCRVIKSRVVSLDSKQPGIEDEYFKSVAAKNAQGSAESSSLLGMLPNLESPRLLHFLDIFPSAPTAPDSIDIGNDDSKNKAEADKANRSEGEKKVEESANTEQEGRANEVLATNNVIVARAVVPKTKEESATAKPQTMEMDEVEDICQRIVQQHVKRKRKAEKAKKKAIQEHLHHKTRSDKVSMTSTISSRTTNSGKKVQARTGIKKGEKSASPPPSCREGRNQSDMVRNLTSTKKAHAEPIPPTRVKPKSQQNYKVTSGLKKTRKPLMKTARREKAKGNVNARDSLKGVYKE